jgi:hypothetical protein
MFTHDLHEIEGYLAWDTYVYGTGYYYPPFWYRRPNYPPIYYPRPVFYGSAVYNEDGSWGRYGYAYGPHRGVEAGGRYNAETGAYVRGAEAWGPYGQRGFIAAGNVDTGRAAFARGGTNPYSTWGSVGVTNGSDWAVARGYSNKAGGAAVGWNTSSGNRGFAGQTANSDLYAGRDGNVYRKTDNGWEKYDGGSWTPVNPPDADGLTSLGAENRGRDGDLPMLRAPQTEGNLLQNRPAITQSRRQMLESQPGLRLRPTQIPSGSIGENQLGNEPILQSLDRTYDSRQRGDALAAQSFQDRVGQRPSATPVRRFGRGGRQ